ncbi:hypothetical protein, conserved [Eimeria acervulina]|uniref:Uncharacterized protein n=1 Tax=Eimeria acervulina TaxID=5801 RepID=U6GB26_EIMAC|nr:hypothetical protein, conserved [Eimeria acervulina]CDI76727.1 hypothetical protein, conserved [Eimeria acervulina]
MARRFALSGYQVPPHEHLQDSLAGESDSQPGLKRPARHQGQEQPAGRTAEACCCFEMISLQTGSYKKRRSASSRLRNSLAGAATAKREVRLPDPNPLALARYFTMKANGRVKGNIVLFLAIICFVRLAACARRFGGKQLEWEDAPEAHLALSEEVRAKAFSLMKHQFAQLEHQRLLEAEAEPSLSYPQNLTAKSLVMLQLDGSAATAAKASYKGLLSSPDNLGAVLVGKADGEGDMGMPIKGELDKRGVPMTAESAPYSFLNWGQIGGMMQNPALAHTGMPVYMPRQVMGTTVGLDFDSPATFHGPLLVLLMVCILIFFAVLLLCCWMVKSKQKHDKFMAEKLPR